MNDALIPLRTPHDHPSRADRFVADAERMHWHDQALWFIREKRDLAVRSLPEWEQLRETAAAIKAHTIAHLDHYLVEFESNARRLGAHVHFALDAEEHNRIVYDILRRNGVRRVAKSKSMLTEECHLNPFLEQRGIEVTDTDLGERIVQLRQEPPSHIVLPAIHLKKEEVGELFQRHLGTRPGASDPKYLTEAARGHLRQKFLEADAGITGVNFAIAETGGFVVCTNEGNADLGTSLTKLHIACMGIEKLIPRAADLGVFIRMLARSATGQPVTAYTSHYHGPSEGAELHIVLVDNGRSEVRARSDFRRSLDCIRCGACLNTCPVYRRSGGHSYETPIAGPIGSILAPAREPERYASLPFASSLCGSCSDVCPVKIDLHQQLLSFRGELAQRGLIDESKRQAMRWASFVFSRPWLYALLGRIVRWFGRRLPRSAIYHRLNVWGRQRELPALPEKSFRQLYRERKRR
jgi:L-lactate dehydrogenase complex protein LldF